MILITNLERQSDYNSGIDWDLIIFKYQMWNEISFKSPIKVDDYCHFGIKKNENYYKAHDSPP